jgi:hypothetical protein
VRDEIKERVTQLIESVKEEVTPVE